MRIEVRHGPRDQRDPPLQHEAAVLVGDRPRAVSQDEAELRRLARDDLDGLRHRLVRRVLERQRVHAGGQLEVGERRLPELACRSRTRRSRASCARVSCPSAWPRSTGRCSFVRNVISIVLVLACRELDLALLRFVAGQLGLRRRVRARGQHELRRRSPRTDRRPGSCRRRESCGPRGSPRRAARRRRRQARRIERPLRR